MRDWNVGGGAYWLEQKLSLVAIVGVGSQE